MNHCRVVIVLFFCLEIGAVGSAQKQAADSDYIRQWAKPNVIELYPGIYNTHFTFSRPDDFKNNYRLVANSSGYIAMYLSYKWLSAEYSWAMPGTQLDKNTKLQYTSIRYRFNTGKMVFHPFYEAYNGLLIPENGSRHRYSPFREIRLADAGTDIFYYTNSRRFSFSAANYFSALQLKSAGAFLVMATPLWQKMSWNKPSHRVIKDSATYRLLSTNPQWVSLVARIGYNYNFIFDEGKWSISPAFLLGGGGLRQISTPNKKLQPVTDMQAWINAGFNGPVYYIYINAWWDDLQTHLLIKNLQRTNMDISITGGYRLGNAKKKILGIL